MTGYVKCYENKSKWNHFFINDKFLEYYSNIWNKSCKVIRKEIDSELVHNKFLKSEIKTGKITSEFYDEN